MASYDIDHTAQTCFATMAHRRRNAGTVSGSKGVNVARYDYRCTSCGTVFEVEHGMGEHPSVSCPECSSAAERVFSTSGIVFTGSGFYNTDQRGSSKTTHKGATSSKSNDSGKKADEAAATTNSDKGDVSNTQSSSSQSESSSASVSE